MNKHLAWAALGALGLVIGCGSGGTTTSTSGGGGSASTSTATGPGGGSASTSTAATGTGGGASTTSATTGAGGGNAGEVCSACVGAKQVYKAGSMCAMTLAKCNADVDCGSWFKCAQNCQMSNFTPECFGACDQSASAVANLYQPVYDCTCNACKSDCGAACP